MQSAVERSEGDRPALRGGLHGARIAGTDYQNATESGSADSPYYTFVDRFDLLGTGSNNVPMVTGNESEALVALVNGQMRSFRVPYPLGYYGKGFDGRIDDPNAGWKGKGLYSTFATRAPFHSEGGKGTTSKVVKWQVRPIHSRSRSYLALVMKRRTVRSASFFG